MPSFVIGRDDTVTDATEIVKGTNGLLMGPVLGHARDTPLTGSTVHIDDVATMHVLSLDGKIVPGSDDFVAVGPHYGQIEWADSFDIVKKRFPKQYEAGIFKFDSIEPPVTASAKADNRKAAKAFGIAFKSFEEQVTSVTGHFLELIGQQ